MKVSNSNNIQRIYQEQLKKVSNGGDSGDAFKKVMKANTSATEAPEKARFHPPSGINVMNPVFSGKPVKEADSVETMKFAAEVMAAQPDIREEKIARIRMAIENGTYNVSPELVAAKLMRSKHLTASFEEA
jgi:flagellar biosynthesis anti-sigma factor FlgM